MKFVVNALLITAAAVLAAPAQAQFSRPESAVKYRQAAFSLMMNHMIRINTQLKSDKPDLKAIESSAALVDVLGRLPYEAFGPGTDVGQTKAKPEIWTDRAKFNSAAEKMQAEAVKLAAISKGGDAKAIRTQFGAVSDACDACHNAFRAK